MRLSESRIGCGLYRIDMMATPDSDILVIEPSRDLVFRAPFKEKNVCQLQLRNTTQGKIGFKMKCTAADYYASNPASGIIEPNNLRTISVFLWKQKGQDLSKLDYKRHKFGVTYLSVANDCTADQIDDIIRKCSKEELKVAFLRSIILSEGEEYHPTPLLFSPGRPRSRLMSVNDTTQIVDPSPLKTIKPSHIIKSPERDLQLLEQELVLKESIISEMQREKEELQAKMESVLLEKEVLCATMDSTVLEQKEKEELLVNMNSTLQRNNEELEGRCRELTALSEQQKRELQLLRAESKQQVTFADISFWEVSYKDVTINSTELGRGAWGQVNVGYYKEQKVAVKSLHRDILSDHCIDTLRREVIMMAKVRHPNLLLFIAVAFDHPTGTPLIITELLQSSLRNAYKEPSKLDHKSKLRIMRDVASALHYLHTHKEQILHRDVSSANVLIEEIVNNTYRGKLSDFGSANLAKFAVSAGPGTELYMAPEVPRESATIGVHNVLQTSKVDVYSYGVLLCEVFAKKPQIPFRNIYPDMLQSIKDEFPLMHQVIQACTSTAPTERPDMIYVLGVLRERFKKVLYED